jgi:hypothetical protein
MPQLRQRIQELVLAKRITRYRFWKDLGCSQNTAYKLYADSTAIPRAEIMQVLLDCYGWLPGDYLYANPEVESPQLTPGMRVKNAAGWKGYIVKPDPNDPERVLVDFENQVSDSYPVHCLTVLGAE